MNNNILKSLRYTLLCTVAAVVSIGFTACADEMFETQNVTAPADGYKICIAANMGGGQTRAIAYNSQTGGYDATFETTDYVFVFNVTKNADGRKKSKNGDWWTSANLHPDANGKTANLVGELAFAVYNEQTGTYSAVTPEVGDELMLFYNCNQYLYYNRYNEKSIADYAIAKVKITSINDGEIKTEPSFFWNPQSIYKINFTGLASDLNIKKVTIQSKQYKLVNDYEPINKNRQDFFGNVTYNYGEEGIKQHELIFLLRFSNDPNMESSIGDVITFRAIGSDDHYYSGTKTFTDNLENGKYYHADLAMTDGGLAMTLTNHTTKETVVVDSWTQIKSKDAAYTIANNGYDTEFSWFGGENTLTFKDVSLNTPNSAIWVYTDNDDFDNTKNHYLVLDGVNTLICSNGNYTPDAIVVGENSILRISATSAGGKLNITSGGFGLNNNSIATIESGEVYVNGYFNLWRNSTLKVEGGVLTVNKGISSSDDGSCCMISKSGKVRISKNSYVREGLIKAANGYALMVNQDGDYLVYTVIEDDGSGRAKSIVVTPATTTLYYSSSLGYIGGNSLSAHVYPENITNKSVTWKTSDPNVVYVNEEGWVESKGIGVATVTATTNDGTNLSAECIVTVKPAGGIKYKNVYISKSLGSQPFINPLTIVGKGITSVSYTSSDKSIATVNTSTGEVTIAAGATVGQTVTITATATAVEDGEYVYPEWLSSASYEISIESPVGEGQRDDYIHDSW